MRQLQIYLTSMTKGSHPSRQFWLKLLDLYAHARERVKEGLLDVCNSC
ncbi:hypothetical protein Goshw_003761 [Gossypium schwendimanii]|uniref:Uncharacterized protein n=2 Tax=Gossypium schwendimanii TaxID=34291 RepID=A0A7J9LE20_GOSSC|nr:hypothetical protein [Gossypium schwendimanii]